MYEWRNSEGSTYFILGLEKYMLEEAKIETQRRRRETEYLHLFIHHSFNTDWLNIYYVLGRIPGAEV